MRLPGGGLVASQTTGGARANVFEVDGVVKRYPGQARAANDGVSFAIPEGEIFGILGENGAGKSTLVRQMVNLLRSTSGSIRLFGVPVEKDPTRTALRIGYMPQQSDALNHLTVAEALYYTAHLRGLTRAEARDECDALVDLWQLQDLRDRDSAQLSGGQKRLLRLAVAMAGRPPVLVLDEPTNDLDPSRRRLVWEVLEATNAKRGTTIAFITHDAAEAEKVIQRVGIMHRGRLVAIGRPGRLKASLGRKLRVDLRLSPDHASALPAGFVWKGPSNDRCTALLEWGEAVAALASIDASRVEDVRIHSPTLEDVFLRHVTGPES